MAAGRSAGGRLDRPAAPPPHACSACDIAFIVLVGSVPIAAWLDLLTLTQLVVVCLLGGVVSVFFSPAYGAYLPR